MDVLYCKDCGKVSGKYDTDIIKEAYNVFRCKECGSTEAEHKDAELYDADERDEEEAIKERENEIQELHDSEFPPEQDIHSREYEKQMGN